ncbi:hypothetical protein NJC38_26650 [Pseudomonas sp. 21LCFQ010]|uniref:PilW family protein n=1 Tax=Pseudomonas sp. 21LCFQ010 TaxID=2957506 RepID=UPI00209858D9|nr:hypothetical protein [Pseudomonas sp. 21LCFQ010]MCO8165719.1 hypothetical protein [Pseudomonas sp. 21LCFQ010]
MKRPQRGFNLISLMIGMTLSLISILAMLALYKNMVGISVRSIQDAQQDGQVSAGLLTAQLEMRNAGFGMDLPISNSIVLLKDAKLTGGTITSETPYDPPNANKGNALLWASKTSASPANVANCAGLMVQGGQLLHLKSAGTCTDIHSDWRTLTWSSTILVKAPEQPSDDNNYGNVQPSGFFKTESSKCWPYGKYSESTLPDRLKVIMTASISAKDSTGSAIQSTSEVCLPNLPAPPKNP